MNSADENPLTQGESTSGELAIRQLPGEFGPVLSVQGLLHQVGGASLEAAVVAEAPSQHAVVALDLSGCIDIDVDGLVSLLEACRVLRSAGSRLVLVATEDGPGPLLRIVGIDWLIPVFPSLESAERAIRGGGDPLPPPVDWEEARTRTLARWLHISRLVQSGPKEALRRVATMFAFCERAEALVHIEAHPEEPQRAGARCHVCPLYYALGGEAKDLGCRSALDPAVEALRVGDLAEAARCIDNLCSLIERMPLHEHALPLHPKVRPRAHAEVRPAEASCGPERA